MDGGDYCEANIHEGIDSTLMLLRSKMTNIDLVKEYDENPPIILCYPSELNQVFVNLLANAIDAMNGKGRLIISTQKLFDRNQNQHQRFGNWNASICD